MYDERSSSTNDTRLSPRRTFLQSAALAGAAALSPGGGSDAEAAPAKSERPLRVGAMSVGEFSFWPYTWGDLLAPEGEPIGAGKLGTALFNMEITHVWDVNPGAARTFAEKVCAEAVERYVAFGGYYEAPWQHRLARPYIEAGIPTYLGRPFAYSLRDIDGILELAAKHSTPIMATDIYEHLYAATTLVKQAAAAGEIECVHGTCLCHEYPALFHTPYLMFRVFGTEIDRVAVVTDDPNASSYLAATYIYRARDGRPAFPATITMTPRGDLYSLTVTGAEGIETSRLPVFGDHRDDLLVHHVPLLVAMQRTFEGETLEPLDNVRKKTELFLTGMFSAQERGCAPVDVGAVPADWRAKPVRPDWIDDGMFGR